MFSPLTVENIPVRAPPESQEGEGVIRDGEEAVDQGNIQRAAGDVGQSQRRSSQAEGARRRPAQVEIGKAPGLGVVADDVQCSRAHRRAATVPLAPRW